MAVSESQFSSGWFEFKIKPNLTNGIVTVFGISDEGMNPQDPFFQVVFDSGRLGKNTSHVVLGGFEGMNPIEFPINGTNLSTSQNENSTFDDKFYTFMIGHVNK